MEKFEFGKKEWFSESKKNEFAISFATWVNSLPEKEEINQDLIDKYKNLYWVNSYDSDIEPNKLFTDYKSAMEEKNVFNYINSTSYDKVKIDFLAKKNGYTPEDILINYWSKFHPEYYKL